AGSDDSGGFATWPSHRLRYASSHCRFLQCLPCHVSPLPCLPCHFPTIPRICFAESTTSSRRTSSSSLGGRAIGTVFERKSAPIECALFLCPEIQSSVPRRMTIATLK